MTLALERLACPACGASMKGEPFDVLFVCGGCGSGAAAEAGGLEKVAAASLRPADGRRPDVWKPGWLIRARVEIAAREVATGGAAGIQRAAVPPIAHRALEEMVSRIGLPGGVFEKIFTLAPESQGGKVTIRHAASAPAGDGAVPESVRAFLVPAFDLPLGSLVRLARSLHATAGVENLLADPPREPVTGGVLDYRDALKLATHFVIGGEAARPDLLASITVTLAALDRRIVALPFAQAGSGLRCAVTGVEVAGPAG